MLQYPIPRIVIALSIGIVFADRLNQHQAMPFLFAILLICTIVIYLLFRSKPLIASLSLTTSFMLLGALLMANDWADKRITLPNSPISYQAVVSSPPILKGNKYHCDITTTSFSKDYKLKAYIISDTTLRIGNRLDCFSQWNEPRNFADTLHYDYALYLRRHGYIATTFLREPKILPAKEHSFRIKALLLRDRLLSILLPKTTEADNAQATALISAMVLGDKTQLSQQTKAAYSDAGVAHVLALSGLHISILLSILGILLQQIRPIIRGFIQLLFVWAFTILVGLPVSLLRVALMFTLLIISKMTERRKATLNNLFVAAFIVLLFSPQSLFDVSFQLSFTAVFFILIADQILCLKIDARTRFNNRRKMNLLSIPLMSFAAQVGTLPIILYHFGQFPVYFLLTNLFICFLAKAILALSMLTLAVSFIAPLHSLCQEVLVFVAASMNKTTEFIASLPHSTLSNLYINTTQAILCYLLIALLLLPFFRKKHSIF